MRAFLILLLLVAVILTRCNSSHNTPPERLTWTFPTEGVSKLVIRASRANRAAVDSSQRSTIIVSGVPRFAANSFHSSDPDGRETPANKWPFEVMSSREGNVLTLTVNGETKFPQHHYFLEGLEIEVPPGVEVIRESQASAKATR